MYSRHHRKARILFGLSDVVLTALAFQAAYQIRLKLRFERVFFLTPPVHALLLGYAILTWVLIGMSLGIYERLDSAKARAILRDGLRQCALAGVALVIFEYLLRLDLSRPFLALFVALAGALTCLFRLNAGRLAGLIRREFTAPHYILIVGLGDRARKFAGMIEQSGDTGARLIGFLSGDQERPPSIRIGGE